jgi:predicted aspartyl protease
MADDMGILRTDVELESPLREGDRRLLREVLVDTGAELSWAPAAVLESLGITRRKTIRFQQADGTILERWVGFAIVHAGGTFTTDEVVFGEPGDLVLLGARSLEGLNLKVDLVGKRLVSAGPMLAAAGVPAAESSVKLACRDCQASHAFLSAAIASPSAQESVGVTAGAAGARRVK